MFLLKDVVVDVIEMFKGVDFYILKYELIFEVIFLFYFYGELIDVVVVMDEFIKIGELGCVGGVDYLYMLILIVLIVVNVGYYVGIVLECVILCCLVDVGICIVQFGYVGEGDVIDIVNNVQVEIYLVIGIEIVEDYVLFIIVVDVVIEEIEVVNGCDGLMMGILIGFKEFDELINGLYGGQMIVVVV